jgi:hypothetical protein
MGLAQLIKFHSDGNTLENLLIALGYERVTSEHFRKANKELEIDIALNSDGFQMHRAGN